MAEIKVYVTNPLCRKLFPQFFYLFTGNPSYSALYPFLLCIGIDLSSVWACLVSVDSTKGTEAPNSGGSFPGGGNVAGSKVV